MLISDFMPIFMLIAFIREKVMSPQRYAPFYKIIVQSLIHRDVTAIPNRECDGPLYTVYIQSIYSLLI